MTKKTLKSILYYNINRTLEVTDEQFHICFKGEILKKREPSSEYVIETTQEHLNRFLDENKEITYYSMFSGGVNKHYFKQLFVRIKQVNYESANSL